MMLSCWLLIQCYYSFTPTVVVVPHPSHQLSRKLTSSDENHLRMSSCLFGKLFGNEQKTNEDSLALYPKLATSSSFDSLNEYLQQWAKLFDDKGMGLTTRVSIHPVTKNADEIDSDGGVVAASGVRLLFPKVDNAYKDKDDKEEEDAGTKKDKKKKDAKPGGVEILVEKLQDDSIQVRAQRCEMDEGTMIREMSEETILSELKKAIGVWKKENS